MGEIPISCKCITYGRTHLLEEAVESFLRQDYLGDKELVIVNDYPKQKIKFNHPNIKIHNLDFTFDTIGQKENYAVQNCKYSTIAVWDDDDIALPNHLNNINKYFPGNDLLHWKNGALVHKEGIKALTGLGNSGIVYTKDMWEKAGGHPSENAGYDMTFVVTLKNKLKAKVINAAPLDKDVSWFYMWGGRTYHMSGMGKDTPDRANVIERHKKFVEDTYVKKGIIKLGEYVLNPHWKKDYSLMLENYNKTSILDKSNLNNFAISEEMFQWLQTNLEYKDSILEFGAGRGTIELAKLFKVFSVESNPKWIGLSNRANYLHVPIKDKWYDTDILRKSLKHKRYQAIIIDGPNVRNGDRKKIVENLGMLNTSVPILVDDTQRQLEKNISILIGKKIGRTPKTIVGHQKNFDII